MRFGFFVLILSTDCYSQPASALHSHISMCKFDLFLGKYHQTESCFWASSPSKGTRSFSSQAWHGRSPPTLVMFMTTMQCGNHGSGCQSSGDHSILLFESKKVGFWKICDSKWNGGAPPHPFFWGREGEEILKCLWVWGWLMFITSKWAPDTRREVSKGARKLHRCTFFLNCISGWSLSWYELGMFHILH